MNYNNSQFKQRGVFSVEFALIAVFFSMLLVFSGDVIIKLSTKGKLDRLSYSLVSIMKERSKLYPVNNASTQAQADSIAAAEADALYTIAANSLTRTMGSFKADNLGMLVEQQTFTPSKQITKSKGTGCSVSPPLDQLTQLSVVSSWEQDMGLYRVTLCYKTDNWFGTLVKKSYRTVSSSSVIIGR